MKSLILISFIATLNLYIFAQDTKTKDPVVAQVNDGKITLSELEAYHKARLLQFSNRQITKSSSLADLINRELTLQKAKKEKRAEVPEVKAQMENVLYQAEIANDLNQEFFKIKIGEDDVKEYYKNNPEYRTSLILLRLPAQPSSEEVKSVYERAIQIYQQVRSNPQNFDAIAKDTTQISPDINPNIPDIGFQPAKQLSPEYFQEINGKSIGTIVAPFRTQFGFNIVKVTGVKPLNDINQDLYRAILFEEKKQDIINSYFSKLADKAQIKINENFLK